MTSTSQNYDGYDGHVSKNILKWMLTIGITVVFGAGAWAMNTTGRLDALEKHSVSREEAAKLQGSIDLLRQEITYLRNDLRGARE